VNFVVIPTDIDETPLPHEHPGDLAARLAAEKAGAGARAAPGAIVLAADTVVALDGRSVGKPETPSEAVAMLRALRGRNHQVISAVAVARLEPEGALVGHSRLNTTDVEMRDYTDAEIAAS
jgi:septum formation protein